MVAVADALSGVAGELLVEDMVGDLGGLEAVIGSEVDADTAEEPDVNTDDGDLST